MPVIHPIPKSEQIELLKAPGLLTASRSYKPLRYPWALDFWRRQQQIHWMPEEIPLGEDCKDWSTRITDAERNLLTQVFRFFTQSDIEVQDNYMERYARVFRPTEIKMMLAAFANMETVHIAAYALLLETLGMPDSEFAAFLDYEAMRDKHDYMRSFGVETDGDILRTLAMFGGFAEGLQLFASFAILLNFPRHNKMRGMGQVVSWSVRDETLHCEGIIRLFHTFASETGALTDAVRDDIVDCARTVVRLEDRFIDLAFELGPIDGLTAPDVKSYIRYIADWRLRQLGLPNVYGVEEHPLPWLTAQLNGVEHANFFETLATEYAKAATGGAWHGEEGAWGLFDRRVSRRVQRELLGPTAHT
jgi:ribonucleoside-diphosphate reductase beta chain